MSNPAYQGIDSEGNYTSDFLKWEQSNGYSRESAVLGTAAADVDLPAGTVLEGALATGVIVWGGTNTITGILADRAKYAKGDVVEVSVIVRDAIIDVRGLNWGAGDISDLATLKAALPTVIVRDGA